MRIFANDADLWTVFQAFGGGKLSDLVFSHGSSDCAGGAWVYSLGSWAY